MIEHLLAEKTNLEQRLGEETQSFEQERGSLNASVLECHEKIQQLELEKNKINEENNNEQQEKVTRY